MKYVVTVRGERTEVIVEPGHIEIGGERAPPAGMEGPGTPRRALTIGNAIHEVVVRARQARGHEIIRVGRFSSDLEAM